MTHNYLEDSVHQPSAADVKQAEIVVNVVDGIAYTSTDGSDVVDMGGAIIHQNPNVLNHNYELRAGMSGVAASGLTIADTKTFTIPDGSTLSII